MIMQDLIRSQLINLKKPEFWELGDIYSLSDNNRYYKKEKWGE